VNCEGEVVVYLHGIMSLTITCALNLFMTQKILFSIFPNILPNESISWHLSKRVKVKVKQICTFGENSIACFFLFTFVDKIYGTVKHVCKTKKTF
jgi:hypothetical protein